MDVKSRFSECEPALDDRPIRQGDIIRFHDPGDLWGTVGVIVTGDCDIARNKHAGRLTFVPILRAQDYLSLFFLPRRLEATSKGLGDRLVSTIRKAQKRNLPEFSTPISSQRALDWTLENDPHEVADVLALIDTDERSAFLQLAETYVRVVTAQQAPFNVQRDALCAGYRNAQRPVDETTAFDKLRNDVRDHLRKLPDDAIFLSTVDAVSGDGYVCYLRVLRDVGDDQIAIRPRDCAEAVATRISHLRSPYVYRLTQQLSGVFSSIGLPSEYESTRHQCADIICGRPPDLYPEDPA